MSPALKKTLRAAAILLLIGGAGAGVAAFLRNRPVPVTPVEIARDTPIRVFGLGTVEARVSSKLGFEVGATLSELLVDQGDEVKQGQILARLSTGEQEAKILKAKAALSVAEVNIRRADANIQKADAVLAQRVEANKRKQTLVGRDIVSAQTAEEAERDVAVARADATVARGERDAAKAQVEDAQAQLSFEAAMLNHRVLRAPYDGRVIERHKEAGSIVKAGDPIFTLVAAGAYWGLAYVDEARAGAVEEGQSVEARLRSRPREAFLGKVARVALESDRATEERRVYVRGETPPRRVFLGEQVEVWITVATLKEALLVPEAATQGFDGRRASVWTVENGVLARRVVEIGHRTEDARLEIVGGLPEGARVAARIEPGFREGRRVTLAATEAAK